MHLLQKILEIKLKFLAKIILKKYKPEIIGVTGSVGKTSTKQAIHTVLEENGFKVRQNKKNYNNELGLPLTIIDSETGGKNIFKWILVGLKATKLILFKDINYPKILVLEMAADKPGDMKYLVNLASCHIGVVTNVSTVHTEFFGTVQKVAEEKSQIIKHLKSSDFAIIAADDDLSFQMKAQTKATTFTFGFSQKADFSAEQVELEYSSQTQDVTGLSFYLKHEDKTYQFKLPNLLGSHLIFTVLPSIIVGMIYKIDLEKISLSLEQFESPVGRMKLIDGIKDTQIIDDSYNSSPLACMAAIKTLSEIKLPGNFKKYAVLGDMLELGSISEQAHQEMGEAVVDFGIDVLFTVGERARDIARGAENKGMLQENIFTFVNSEEAGKFLQQRIKQGDLILIKGSQGVRMERITKEIMAEPMKAKDLLVRQDKSWVK
ncbi:UDP-N-acetylmuramoyl-tripeptide--D-alanyl-D-alanine ligase [Patescibacteria group bacterium]|nr:UDP-N-acetylmuramoyl-tripeptide--D-alanyl-D-alanine ligase [Patescibacteria group bacterium]